MICPKCGNTITDETNGNCYNCLKSENDYKRFGGSSKLRPQPRRRIKRGQITKAESGHIISPEGAKPKDQDKPSGRTSAKTKKKKQKASQPVNRPDSVLISEPPNMTPLSQIKNPVEPAKHLSRQSTLPQNDGAPIASSEYERRLQRKGINQLLNDIYGRSRLLSDILRDGSLSDTEILQLRQQLSIYLAKLVYQWHAWWSGNLPPRRGDILVRWYGLDGRPPIPTETLSVEHNLSHEYIQQLYRSGLEHLRSPFCQQKLESIVVETAQTLLYVDKEKSA